MFYSLKLNHLPVITNYYSVIRDTVWQTSDEHNILLYIQDGTCQIKFDNEIYNLKKGDIFFIPKNQQYKRTPIDNIACTMTYIHFDIDTDIISTDIKSLRTEIIETKNQLDLETLSGETLLSYPNIVYMENKNTPKKSDKIASFIKDIKLFSNNRQLTCNLQSSVNLCNILIALSSDTIEKLLTDSSIKNAPIIPTNLKKAINYIAQHYSEQISLDNLAELCNISKQQLIRYFKNSLNTTPIKYITDYKISRAKDLLCNHSHLTIKEISAELGFENQHYFTRVFTKITGESPTDYKSKAEYNKSFATFHSEQLK